MQVNPPPSVLVTGAQSGLGKATAIFFKSLGSHVFSIDKDNCDVTDFQKVSSFINSLSEIPRVWVNCAGVFQAQKILKMSSEEFKNIIDVNLIGSFNIIKCAAEKLAQLDPINSDGERGVIINTASIAAFEGQVGQVAYSASKAGIAGMTLPLARELAPLGIRVMAIAPGPMETPMATDKISEKVKQALTSSIPFPKRFGYPEEFARLVHHIVENSYLNGSVIRLDAALRMAAT
ncbi:MAG TPA: SDR family NAD(P)-dependent oxidoreductase [Gammaproteobacteria bacterium]|nr:SDR family NAD(P)-dependent oxidoreductase [Gammaproteobacteria bacterium]